MIWRTSYKKKKLNQNRLDVKLKEPKSEKIIFLHNIIKKIDEIKKNNLKRNYKKKSSLIKKRQKKVKKQPKKTLKTYNINNIIVIYI